MGFNLTTSLLTEEGKSNICDNCLVTLRRSRLPALGIYNGLLTEEQPNELQLTEIEENLIALEIIYIKIFRLPTSRMPGVRSRTVNIPLTTEDVTKKLSSLPRQADDSGLINVNVKRKLEHSSSVYEGVVRTKKIFEALEKLKGLNNKFYIEIEIDYDLNFKPEEIDLEQSNKELEEAIKAMDEADAAEKEYCTKDSAKRFQTPDCPSTVLAHKNPDQEVLVNKSSKTKTCTKGSNTFTIAPGEGKIPHSILRSEHWESKSFPTLFPSGLFDLDHDRSISLSAQRYFVQRMFNRERRWSKHPAYVFACTYFIERIQMETAITTSFKKGKFRKDNEGKGRLESPDEGVSVFKNIKGTTKYWRRAKHELLAR